MSALTPAERLVSLVIRWTWPLYFVGALYVVGPVLGWCLVGLAALSLYFGPVLREDMRPTGDIPPVVFAWMIGMSVMLVALWIGHIDWKLGIAQTIKSSIGWAKGWALMALFVLAGAVLPIRRHVLTRGQCVVGLWTLCLLPILAAAPYIGLPEAMYTSPLKAVGGPGPEYFRVYFYTLDPASWTPRWQFYAPWSPFAGLLGVVMILFALEESERFWLTAGVLAGLAMILMSQSRMSLVALVVCVAVPRLLPLALKSWAWAAGGVATASLAAFGAPLLALARDGVAAFKNTRADSTRVRETLQRIAEERWSTEAFWTGHGIVLPGPHLVEYMPIGSHHTWYGLLFVKGVVGFAALLIPLAWQLGLALIDAAQGPRGRLPLGIMLVLIILSFGENIEIEAYLLWPALMMLGLHARELANDRPA